MYFVASNIQGHIVFIKTLKLVNFLEESIKRENLTFWEICSFAFLTGFLEVAELSAHVSL